MGDCEPETVRSRLHPFGNGFCLGKEEQIVVPTRLGIRPRHVKSAKRVGAHQRARALAVQ